jgi:hypothetical protein
LPLDATQSHTITDPENKTHSLKPGETFTTSQIGLHKVQSALLTQTIAVNLPPDEGRALPLEPQKLAEYGIKLASTSDTAAASETTDQRLTATDTEQRQNLWWWFLVTLLAVLLLETAVAGRSRQVATAT